MKRNYLRWSAIGGALLSGVFGTYQGVRYFAQSSSEQPAAVVPGTEPQSSPQLIADSEAEVRPAQYLTPGPGVPAVPGDAPIVRGNDNFQNDPAPIGGVPLQSDYSPAVGLPAASAPSAAEGSPAAIGSQYNPTSSAPPIQEYSPTGVNGNELRGSTTMGIPADIAPLAGDGPARIGAAPIDSAPNQVLPLGAAPISPAPLVNGNSPANIPQFDNNTAPPGLATESNLPAPVGAANGYGQLSNDPAALPPAPAYTPNNDARFNPSGVAQNYPLPPNPVEQPPLTGSPGAVGQGEPGARKLEGPQSPQIVIEKRAPQEVQVNIPATFEIYVRNIGTVDAQNVTVADQVPKGTQFIDASPTAEQVGGSIRWQLNSLKPGDERVLTFQVLPVTEGEIGSVAQVSFQAVASARTICTKPVLKIEQKSAPRILVGEFVTFSISITNTGTGPALDVVLENDVPAGLSHDQGSELRHEIGQLPAGASRSLELTLRAEKPGSFTNVIRAHGKGDVVVESTAQLEIVAPDLQLGVVGPKQRYLNRKATYTFSVSNPGTAPANDIELVSYLPKGFEFVEADKQGHYDPRKHAVYWSLAQLPPEQKGEVNLIIVPVEPGEHKVRAEGRAQRGLTAANELLTSVYGLSELRLSIEDSADPIEIGKDTTYEIRVSNTGSKDATNVRLIATLPVGLKAIGADGPSSEQVEGQQVTFQPLSRLTTNNSVVYRVQAQGIAEGDQQIKVHVVCDDSQAPTVYEEVTRVYSDR